MGKPKHGETPSVPVSASSSSPPAPEPPRNRQRTSFIERTLNDISRALEHAARAEELGEGTGLLQRLDPRVKLGGLLLLICAAAASHRLGTTAALFGVGLTLSLSSGRRVMQAVARLWAGIAFFAGAVVLPALFTTPGPALCHLPGIGWTVTMSGFASAVGLITRSETTATLAALMVLTTRWPHLLKALSILRMPVVFIVLLQMTHRYVFLLLETAQGYFEARRARAMGVLEPALRRQMAVSSAAVLLSKSVQLSGEVYQAMLARGFQGTVYTLDEFEMTVADWLALTVFTAIAGAAFWTGCR